MASFLGEIKRRKVFQVAAVYAVVAWLLVQIVATVEAPLNLPVWFDTAVIVFLAVGFPIAIILGWAYDVTPRGVERTGSADSDLTETMPAKTGLAVNLTVIVALALLIALVALYVFLREGPASTGAAEGRLPNSVAVLPFANLSPNPDDAYFAAGIHDTILTELAKIADLSVIGRTSVLRYADGLTPVAQIARELHVETIMEGTVQFAEGQVRIVVQLIDPASGAHRWAETYDRDFSDIFVIQSDIAARIAESLEAELTPRERASLARAPTQSSEAAALYFRAIQELRSHLGGLTFTEDSSAVVRGFLARAIDADPNFADAHAMLARDYAYALGRDRRLSSPLSTPELERLAMESAERALRIESENGLALGARAVVHRLNRRWADAREDFERALAASPNETSLILDYMMFDLTIGQFEAAVGRGRRLVELDPSAASYDNLAFALTFTESYDEAENATLLALDLGTTEPGARGALANINAARGDHAQALYQLQLAEEALGPDSPTLALAELIYSYGRSNSPQNARRVLDDFMRRSTVIDIGPGLWAYAYLGLRDRERALAWLGQAVENPAIGNDFVALYKIAANLYNDPILDEPEFVELRERLEFRE